MHHYPDDPKSWKVSEWRKDGAKKGGDDGGVPVKAGEMVLFSTLHWAQ